MKYRLLFVAFLIMLCCVSLASAVTLNATEVATSAILQYTITNSGDVNPYVLDLQEGTAWGGGGGFGGGGAGGRGVPTTLNLAYTGHVLAKQTITFSTENCLLNFQYTRIGEDTITGWILLTPDGGYLPLSGTETIHITNNGFETTERYLRSPIGGVKYDPVVIHEYTVVDAGTGQQYFTMGSWTSVPSKWDNATYANIPISDITRSPIYKISFDDVASTDTFIITSYSVKGTDYAQSLVNALAGSNATVCGIGGVFLPIAPLLCPFMEDFNLIGTFLSGVAGFVSLMLNLGTYIFLGEFFLGINVFYMSIAIVLSIEDSDDMFWSFRKFMRYMLALKRFYMELFSDLKKLILPWIS
jgi:hypothetical protein